VLVIFSPVLHHSAEDVAWAIIRAQKEYPLKPVLTSFMGEGRVKSAESILAKEGIPYFLTPIEAVKSFLYMYLYDHYLKLLLETPGTILQSFSPDKDSVERILLQARQKGLSSLKAEMALEVLEAYGLRATKCREAESLAFFLGAERDPVFGEVILFGLGGLFLKP